mmetsp:Transcript_19796/g.32102  ORF Transcript_19796/g.32102 Transcript_19796/m.32102 type:complete len:204 (+) Transcript_19796:860-1471(+)
MRHSFRLDALVQSRTQTAQLQHYQKISQECPGQHTNKSKPIGEFQKLASIFPSRQANRCGCKALSMPETPHHLHRAGRQPRSRRSVAGLYRMDNRRCHCLLESNLCPGARVFCAKRALAGNPRQRDFLASQGLSDGMCMAPSLACRGRGNRTIAHEHQSQRRLGVNAPRIHERLSEHTGQGCRSRSPHRGVMVEAILCRCRCC